MAELTDSQKILQRLAKDRVSNNTMIDPSFFLTPDMGDYMRDEMTLKNMKTIEDKLNVYDKQGLDAAYFIETPYSTTPGYYSEISAFVIKASPLVGDKDTDLRSYDADTVYFTVSSINDGSRAGAEIDVNGKNYTGFKDYLLQSVFDGNTNTGDMSKLYKFGLRFLGLNAPEIPHYSEFSTPTKDIEAIPKASKSIESIKDNPKYIYDKSLVRDDSTLVQFIKNGGDTWSEIITSSVKNDKTTYRIVFNDDSSASKKEKTVQGLKARDVVKDYLSGFEDMCIVVDAKTLSHNKTDDDAYVAANSMEGIWNKFWGKIDYSYYGYNFWGQDSYKRFLGCVYVKKNLEGYGSVWINLSKYILANFKDVELLPEYIGNPMRNQSYGYVSDAFKMWTYLRTNKPYADALFDISKQDMDDRNQIQKDILGIDFDSLKDFTVMIGDCLFMVPPTSIRCVSQTQSERVPLLRAKGSMTKGTKKAERILEMTLYFNEDGGVNGVPYPTTLPNGEQVIYYMNGLRSLISQFKFTPFLPIENTYINQTLNIEAVALSNLQISTMPGYPKTLAATLSLTEFNYRIYMPELPVPLPDDPEFLTRNMFSATINYEVMRWYYQRSILKGNEIKDYAFSSKNYLDATFGTQTALQPMSFTSSEAQFYIIDKNWLDKQLQVKLAAASRSEAIKGRPTVTDDAKKWRNELAKAFLSVNSAINNSTFKERLAKLNDQSTSKVIINSSSASEQYSNQFYKTRMERATLTSSGTVDDIINESDEIVNTYLNPVASSFKSALTTQLSIISGVDFAERFDVGTGETDILSIMMKINVPRNSVLVDSEIDDLMLNLMGGKTPDGKDSGDSLMTYYDKTRSCVYIRFSAKFSKDTETPKMTHGFELDASGNGYKFLAMCAGTQAFVTNEDVDDIDGTEEFMDSQSAMTNSLTNMKESIDYENEDSLHYVPYPIDNIIVKNVSCVYGNTMSRISLQAQDGYAPQYAGGQDTIIELTIETNDIDAVTLLNSLPVMSAQYVRDYRQVLPCWPVRIDNELTRLLGVNEVLIENVDVSTRPNFPGHYEISIRLTSVDRTMRNKEALKKIDVPVNAGAKTIDGAESFTTKSYFDLNNTLAKAEVYPDLELPTVDELSKKGFEFIRYKSGINNRVFPDPDFYFVYGWILGSEIFRNSILENLNANYPAPEFNVADKYGDEFTIKAKAVAGYEYKAANAQTEARKADKKKQDKETDKIKNTPLKNASSDPNTSNSLNKNEMIAAMSNLDTYGSWNIADTVKCIFREKQYDDIFFSNSKKNDENAIFLKKSIDARVANVVALIDKELSKEVSITQADYDYVGLSDIKVEITRCVNDYFFNEDSVGYKILMEVGSVDGSENLSLGWWPWGDKTKLCNSIKELMWSAAAAASGQKEFESEFNDPRWQPISFTESIDSEGKQVPYALKTEAGTSGGIYQAASMNDAIENGITFGPFQTKLYTKKELQFIIGESVEANSKNRMLLDPAYRGKTSDELKPLLTAIMNDPYIAAQMFIRNTLFWMKKMAEDSLLVSIYDLVYSQAINNIGDIHVESNLKDAAKARGYTKTDDGKWVASSKTPTNSRGVTTDMLAQAEQAKKDYYKDDSATAVEETPVVKEAVVDPELEKAKEANDASTDALIKMMQETMEKNKAPLGTGKMFVPMLLALTSGDDYIYSMIKGRNYDSLNELVRSVPLPTMAFSNGQGSSNTFRKFILAMGGYGLIKDLTKIGTTKTKNVSEVLAELVQEKVYLEAAEDPRQYLMHSFYDMIINDKRGRMLRAFPTFYMMFVDEGREIGLWKMHDNFYNMSSISEIQVTKSRKIAADTARIVMTNMYNTFDTVDEDSYLINDYGVKDVFNSIFSPRKYFMKEEAKRLDQANIQRAKLMPGTRIHLRVGYGSNASELPILFNGCIAEIGGGEAIEIVAQGDGVELTNPLVTKTDAEDIQNEDKFIIHEMWDNWLTKGATPRTILGSFLTTKGGFLEKSVFNLSDGRFFNKNPYGISHFGEPEYKPIFQSGEVLQNIYEGTNKPSWGKNGDENDLLQFYNTESAPRISAHVFGKSYWDMMHICRSACPDYMTSIVPFGLRSSVFFGPPRAYCAYDYVQDANGVIKEKRKPFQQYHIYNSYSDIIANKIKSSNMAIKTCAVGMYTGATGPFGGERPEKVGPMWVDFDIYPENQKTMTVDTQFLAKGTAAGDIIPYLNMLQNTFGKADSASFQGGDKIAWRMTASALKDTVKDMYDGELIVLGDPSVKPYDRMWIHDSYEQIQGSAEVETVVHNFTVQTGYTTSVYADCIASIDDKYEQISHHWGNDVVQKCIVPYVALVTASAYFSHIGKPVMKVLGSYALNSGEKAVSFVNSISGILGQDQIVRNETYLKKFQSVSKFFGIDAVSVKFDSLLKGFETYKKSLTAFEGVTDLSKLGTRVDDLAKAFTRVNGDDMLKLLVSSGNAEAGPAITELMANQARLATEMGKFGDQALINEMGAIVRASGNNIDELDDILKALKLGVKSPDDLKELSKLIRLTSSHITDEKDIARIAKAITTIAKTAKASSGALVAGVEASAAIVKGAGAVIAGTAAATGGLIGIAAAILPTLIIMGITTAITAYGYEYIERWMKNLQVLQIFPLKKNGTAWTAGLNGSKGVIVGSPSFTNNSNSIEGYIANIFGEKPEQSGMTSILKALFISPEMIDIANNYKQGLDIPVSADDETTMNKSINDLLYAVSVDEVRKHDSYRAMMMQKRVKNLSSQEGDLAYIRTAVIDTNQEADIPNTMIYLLSDEEKNLSKYKDKEALTIFHEEPVVNSDKGAKNATFLANGQNNGNGINAPAIQDTDGTLDLPFLRHDAYYVLSNIMSKLDEEFEKLPEDEGFKKHPVSIQSCLRIREPKEKKSWASTGYCFTINVSDYGLDDLLRKINTEATADMIRVSNTESPFFIWNMLSKSTASILIYPPKNV